MAKVTLYDADGIPHTSTTVERATALAARDGVDTSRLTTTAPVVTGAGGKVVSGGAATTTQSTPQTTDTTVGTTTPQSGTLTAQITSPKGLNTSVAPPAVVTSTAAEQDLASKKTQAEQLNADTEAHQAIVANANTPQQQPTNGTTGTQTPQGQDNSSPASYDDQISELLNGLNDSKSNIDQSTQDQLTPLAQEQQQLDTQLASDAKSALSKLDQISSGTYPLSPAEKNLIAATKTTFLATISAQTTANSAFQGSLAETMASLGIATSAPTQAAGLMFAAISSGNQKVNDLNAQMSQEVAKLQLGFQKEDYAEVSDAWEKTSTYLNDRIDTIKDMQNTILDAAKQQKQDTKDYTTLALQYVTKSAEFSQKEKEDAVDAAYKQAQISETQRHDFKTEAISQENADNNGGAGEQVFTQTQLNSGASNAGLSIGDFKNLDSTTKNYFVNGYSDYSSIWDNYLKGNTTKDDLATSIDSSNLPDNVKSILNNKFNISDTGSSSDDSNGDSSFWDKAGKDAGLGFDFVKGLIGI